MRTNTRSCKSMSINNHEGERDLVLQQSARALDTLGVPLETGCRPKETQKLINMLRNTKSTLKSYRLDLLTL
jgi:hypothetical protein